MVSKICIVSAGNIKHMTLASMYTRILTDLEVDYDLIYFDKYNIDEMSNAKNIYKYTNIINKKWSSLKKANIYLKFGRFAKKILKNNDYELVIVWNTFTALLIYGYLLTIKGKYIHNIRDYFYENSQLLFHMHKKVIDNSLFTTISSKGFREFLPESNYIYVNSINENIVEKNYKFVNRKTRNDKIRIGFIGNIRFFDEAIKLIDTLKNDERFELWFCGTNAEYLEKYSNSQGIKNCKYIYSFEPSETIEILSNFDIINNLFGSKDVAVKTLTSIRLYYGTFYKIPLLVNENTYMDKIISKYGLGLSVNLESENLNNIIFNWYSEIDKDRFDSNCNKFNLNVEKENQVFHSHFSKLVSEFENIEQ